jgi:hypothetical protein
LCIKNWNELKWEFLNAYIIMKFSFCNLRPGFINVTLSHQDPG